jgi:pimeloyl-ACP methyl ester carboxylesterase
MPEVRPGKYGLIGFSFGAPQVAISAARDDLAGHVAGIVLFGGYCSLQRTLTFQMTGQHEWEGVEYEGDPDPFGRWVVASNYLTEVPGYEDAGDVASALHTLADAASSHRVKAWEPYHDAMIEDLREALPARHRRTFDQFARSTDSRHAPAEPGADLVAGLAEACCRVEPLLEPQRYLKGVRLPTRLIHGRGDRLTPFTEGLRLMAGLPAGSNHGTTVTALFDHSADRAPASLTERVRERALLFRALHGLVNTV